MRVRQFVGEAVPQLGHGHDGAGQRGLLERSDLSLTHEVQWQDEMMTKLDKPG
jgi:hypothetical protein